MLAALVRQPGETVLEIVERDIPRPGPGEVLVNLKYATLNYRDLLTVVGGYGSEQKRSDLVPLSDAAGVVAEVGAGVSEFCPGDRVVPCFFQDWDKGRADTVNLKSNLGGILDGVAAEFALFKPGGLVRIPDGMSLEHAAAFPCAGVTAWNAVVGEGGVTPGQFVVTQGTGGVSIFAMQIARMAGARLLSTSSSRSKLENLGLSDVIVDYAAEPQWSASVLRATDGAGADLVVEVGGAETLKQSLKAVRTGGRIAVIGVLSGLRTELNLSHLVQRYVRMQGVTVGHRTHLSAALAAFANSGVRPRLDDRRFSLPELPSALEYMRAGKHIGKILISLGEV